MIIFKVIEDTEATRKLYPDQQLPVLRSVQVSDLVYQSFDLHRYHAYDLLPAARVAAQDGVITLRHTSPDQFDRFLLLLQRPEPEWSICNATKNYLDCVSMAFDLDDTNFKAVLAMELYYVYMVDWGSGKGSILAHCFKPMLETIYKDKTWLKLKPKRRCANLVIAMLARQVMSKTSPLTIDAPVYCSLASYFKKLEWNDKFVGHLTEQLTALCDFNVGKESIEILPIQRFLPV